MLEGAYRGPLPPPDNALKYFESVLIPTRYQAQLELPYGNYRVKVVVTDGEKFGRVEIPLRTDASFQNGLSISEIVLCKRYHRVSAIYSKALRPIQFIPLVIGETEFTSGTARFKKDETLISYFEIYDPPTKAEELRRVQLQMRVADTNTGQVKSDTGIRAVGPEKELGNHVIPLARQIAIDKLSPGNYRLDVQASDLHGNKTEWRATTFTID